LFCDNDAKVYLSSNDSAPSEVDQFISHTSWASIDDKEVILSGDGPWTLSGYCQDRGGAAGFAASVKLGKEYGSRIDFGNETLSITDADGSGNKFDIIQTNRNVAPPADWYNTDYDSHVLLRNMATTTNCADYRTSIWGKHGGANFIPSWNSLLLGAEPIWFDDCRKELHSQLNFKLHLIKENGILFCAP
jgi:hypothetical protein